jgi:hypothetical protein
MKIIIGFILFIFGSLWFSIIISVGVGTALRLWEKRKNEAD